MTTRNDIANKIFPEIKESITDLQAKFPKRENEICSRFAPSPTGFLHIWGLYSALVSYKFTQQNNGTFILRIEDTDQKRKTEWALESLLKSMKTFGIDITEWPIWEDWKDIWNYGPYTQSERKSFYHTFTKELISKGLAYPCWMTNEEIDSIRENQQKAKIATWIYGNYSIRRNKTPEEILQKLEENQDFIIRFRSHWEVSKKIIFEDVIRWKVNMIDNYNDIVLIKSDWLPTYHLAHITDDTLMNVSHIIRAEEWLTSVPLHLQLFSAFDLPAPKYCHLAQLLTIDKETNKKRKLSKRSDPEANVEYFFENWFAIQWVIDYLMVLIDSSFEEFQRENSDKNYLDFDIHLENMNKSGALFDLVKMTSVNNEYLSRIPTQKLLDESLARNKEYNPEFAKLMEEDLEYTYNAINIERHTEKDPKRFSTYKDIQTQTQFFYDSKYQELLKDLDKKELLPACLTADVIANFVQTYTSKLDLSIDQISRFTQLKEIWKELWFAWNNKEFKEWWYIGKIWDLAMFLRLALCASPRTPDLYSTIQVMWKDRVVERLNSF